MLKQNLPLNSPMAASNSKMISKDRNGEKYKTITGNNDIYIYKRKDVRSIYKHEREDILIRR